MKRGGEAPAAGQIASETEALMVAGSSFLPPPRFPSAECEDERPFLRHRWYRSLQFSSNAQLELAVMGNLRREMDRCLQQRGEEHRRERWKDHPGGAHGKGQRSRRFIYCWRKAAAIWGVQSVSVRPAVPWGVKVLLTPAQSLNQHPLSLEHNIQVISYGTLIRNGFKLKNEVD